MLVAPGAPGKRIVLLEKLLPLANHETRARMKRDSNLAGIRAHPDYQRVLAIIGD